MQIAAVNHTDVDCAAIRHEAASLAPFGMSLSLVLRHIGMNRIYVDASNDIVVRIHHDDASEAVLNDNLRHAKSLEKAGAPVVAPLHSECVRLPETACWATYWPRHDENHDLSGFHMGRFIARWHMAALNSGISGELPTFMDRQIAQTHQRCDQALDAGVPAEITETLRDTMCRAAEHIPAEPHFVLHGDMHKRNIVAAGRKPLAIDLDSLCLGRVEHDLAPQAMSILRYRDNHDLGKLLKGYRSYDSPFDLGVFNHALKIREVATSLHGLTRWDDLKSRANLEYRLETMHLPPSDKIKWEPLVSATIEDEIVTLSPNSVQ